MDIPRAQKTGLNRRWILGGAGLALVLLMTVALSRLEPAAPTIERAGVWMDTVEMGTMVRAVRGPGTLVPEQIRYISAVTAGRVERVLLEPGAQVTPETELVILSNPDVQLQLMEAQRAVAGAQSSLANLEATLENQRLNQQSTVTSVRAQYNEAIRQVNTNRGLAERGLIAANELKRTEDTAEELETRLEIEQQRLEYMERSLEAQLNAQRSEIDRLRGLVDFQEAYVASMRVTAGTTGVLRDLPLQEGQWVNPGERLAVVVQPGRLKAELRIPETQVRDVAIGQRALIDMRSEVVEGRVIRIDPASENGTVTVDVALEGEMPSSARPDLSVDGTIEIERLENVMYVGRPAYGQAESAVGLFKLDADGETARRVTVELGRSSVNTIEVRSGLKPGDVVILSDMTTWDAQDRVRLK